MIYFYNTFHNGDIHYSRTFVRDIMNKLGKNDYYYLHNNNPQLLKDFPSLKHDKSFSTFDDWKLVSKYPISYKEQIIKSDDDLFINTWVGQRSWITNKGLNRNRDNRYCSLYSHYELYEDIFDTLSIPIEKINFYLPKIDFDYIEKENIDKFISKSKFKSKVLLVNNFPRTIRIDIDIAQSVNVLSSKFPDVLFILTEKTPLNKENIEYTENIIKLDFDLNEISYLSKFCDIIVGRPSGPYVFCMINDNFVKDKTFITISHNIYDKFYFETESDTLLLTNHSVDSLIDIIEKKIK